MKKLKKMRPGCLYLFKSMACSNTVYYEQLNDAKQFLVLANQHLKDYLYIHEYMLCKDGWVFLGRLKSKDTINRAYTKKRQRKNKMFKQLPVWKIISEQMRLFIAEYVTEYNGATGREGSLVRRPYQRYCFDTVQEAKRMIGRLRRRVVGLQQAKKMYRAKKGHYRIPEKLGKGGIYLSSRREKRQGGKVGDLLNMVVFQRLSKKVLAKLVENTKKHYSKKTNTPIPDI